jgi:hypothetical protein
MPLRRTGTSFSQFQPPASVIDAVPRTNFAHRKIEKFHHLALLVSLRLSVYLPVFVFMSVCLTVTLLLFARLYFCLSAQVNQLVGHAGAGGADMELLEHLAA